MSYFSLEELYCFGFKSLGSNVKVSKRASIYDCNQIEIGDNSRIDDYAVISGNIQIGCNVHITAHCLMAGGTEGLVIEDFCTFAYGVKVFTQSDDYSGRTMTNSTVPPNFKNEKKQKTVLGRHSIIGAGSIIMPGANVAEGVSVGANSLLLKPTQSWSIYAGSPAVKIKNRNKSLLKLEEIYLRDKKNDSI